jgi:hypothetical protein
MGAFMETRSLTEIADAFGTDKGTLGPSFIYGGHNYTDIYEAYLAPLRNEQLRILEIGIGVRGPHSREYIQHGRNSGGGASLHMWHAYFPKAMVFAIDVNAAPHLDNDRVKTFVADQSSESDIRHLLTAAGNAPFDIIIDDGSHRPDHQQASLGLLFPALKSGGLYFIEDLESNGAGDNAFGRHANDSVLNTRHVLKTFVKTGSFPEPHLIRDPAYVAAHVRRIAFHVPQAKSDPLSLFKKARNRNLKYRPGSERLCAITKN